MSMATTHEAAGVRPIHWVVFGSAVLLLAIDIFGGFIAFFVLLPAIAVCVAAVFVGLLSRGRSRALMIVTALVAVVAAAISADVIWVGSFDTTWWPPSSPARTR